MRAIKATLAAHAHHPERGFYLPLAQALLDKAFVALEATRQDPIKAEDPLEARSLLYTVVRPATTHDSQLAEPIQSRQENILSSVSMVCNCVTVVEGSLCLL